MANVSFNWASGPHSGILIIDGLVNKDVTDLLITKLSKIYDEVSTQGQTMGGVDATTKFSMDLGLSSTNASQSGYQWDDEFSYIESSITTALTGAVNYYKSKVKALYAWNDIEDTGFNIQKYPARYGKYIDHVDSSPADFRSSPRVLAAITYLNGVEVGGETTFPDYGVSVSPVSGRLVLFPASWTHTHRGEVPISGDKWIINTFLVSSTLMNVINTNHNVAVAHTHTHDQIEVQSTHGEIRKEADNHDHDHNHLGDDDVQ